MHNACVLPSHSIRFAAVQTLDSTLKRQRKRKKEKLTVSTDLLVRFLFPGFIRVCPFVCMENRQQRQTNELVSCQTVDVEQQCSAAALLLINHICLINSQRT